MSLSTQHMDRSIIPYNWIFCCLSSFFVSRASRCPVTEISFFLGATTTPDDGKSPNFRNTVCTNPVLRVISKKKTSVYRGITSETRALRIKTPCPPFCSKSANTKLETSCCVNTRTAEHWNINCKSSTAETVVNKRLLGRTLRVCVFLLSLCYWFTFGKKDCKKNYLFNSTQT